MPLEPFRDDLASIDQQLVEAIARRVERGPFTDKDEEAALTVVRERAREGARARGLAEDDTVRIFELLEEGVER